MARSEADRPFGVLLQQYRVAAGLSQEQLAERSGLSRRGISDLERGKRRTPHPATARRLADALALDAQTRATWLVPVRSSVTSDHKTRAPLPSNGLHSPERSLPLVGRDAEWADLLSTWLEARTGASKMVVIAGEAGIGKTRLAEELLSWASDRGAATARSRAYAAEGSLAYAPVCDWLRSPTFATSMTRLDPRTLQVVSHLVPELLGERAEHGYSEPEHRQQLFRALARAVLSPARPVLLLLDDLQWCDQDTLEWLHYLLRFDPTAALLVVGTLRADEVDREHPLNRLLTELRHDAQLTELALGSLGEAATAALATCVAGEELDPGETHHLYAQTEGQPLFVVEMVRAGSKTRGQFPPRVYAVISSRLARLSEPARELMRLAATIGRSFSLDLLVEATGGDLESLVAPLDELTNRQIVREHSVAAYDFTHDRIREVAYSEMGIARRSVLHRRVAEALERTSGPDLDNTSAHIAAHLAQAGLAVRAAPYYQRAALAAQRVYAHAEASQLLMRGLALLATLPSGPDRDARELTMQTALGPSLISTRGYGAPEVVTAYRRAQELCQQLGEPPRPPVLRALAIASIARADFDQAHSLGEQLLQVAARTGDPILLVEAHYTLGVALFWKGALTASRSHLEQALAEYPAGSATDHLSLFVQDPRVVCLSRLAMDLWLLGEVQRANTLIAQALELARELSHPNSLGYAQLFAMMLASLQHEVDSVADQAVALLDSSREHAMGLWLSIATIFQGWVQAERGDLRAGLAEMRTGIRAFRSGGNVYMIPFFLGLLAEQLLRSGRLDSALRTLSIALAAVERTGERWCASDLHRLRGTTLLALGDVGDAEAAIRQALAIAQDQQAKTCELRAAAELVRLGSAHAGEMFWLKRKTLSGS